MSQIAQRSRMKPDPGAEAPTPVQGDGRALPRALPCPRQAQDEASPKARNAQSLYRLWPIVGRARGVCPMPTTAGRCDQSNESTRVQSFFGSQQNVLCDAAQDIDLFTLQSRAREEPPYARHQLFWMGGSRKSSATSAFSRCAYMPSSPRWMRSAPPLPRRRARLRAPGMRAAVRRRTPEPPARG